LEPLLTSAEAAKILRVNPKVLERWAKAGDVPALKVGKFWRYRASALESWVDTQLHSESQPCRIEPSF
jgi:excisionase family DNA binding protein